MAIQGFKYFKYKDTEELFKKEKSQRFGAIRKVATRKLTMLEAATVLEDLKSPPGNRLEALVSERVGQHSIRVNDQFRICFVWTDTGPTDVEIPTIMRERLDYMTFKNGMRPVHPGEVLREEYLKPLDLSANALAKALRLSPSRIGDIVLERRGVTADTAVRLARYFGGTAQFWLNLQSIYDLRTAERSAETKRALREIEPLDHSAAA